MAPGRVLRIVGLSRGPAWNSARLGAPHDGWGDLAMWVMMIGSTFGAAILGWVAGMWTRRRADHWCTQCGTTLQCPNCLRAGGHHLNASR